MIFVVSASYSSGRVIAVAGTETMRCSSFFNASPSENAERGTPRLHFTKPDQRLSRCCRAGGRRPGMHDWWRGQFKAPTARAMTSREVKSAAVACIPMRIFTRLVKGIVSVGLNALELVVDT